MGELEITPVSAAIARHLGIDLSIEGKAARNRRGMAVIVNGAPCSGKHRPPRKLNYFHHVHVCCHTKTRSSIATYTLYLVLLWG